MKLLYIIIYDVAYFLNTICKVKKKKKKCNIFIVFKLKILFHN